MRSQANVYEPPVPAGQSLPNDLPSEDLWRKVPAAVTDFLCASNVPAPLIS